MSINASFSVIPISRTYLARLREGGLDDLGLQAIQLRAHGGEPLRDCFRRANAGDPILLASYAPPGLHGPYREFGPIFAHLTSGRSEPPSLFRGSPDDANAYFRAPVALRAYGNEGWILDAVLAPIASAEETIANFLERTAVAFVDARFPAFGCYAARFARRPALPTST